MVSRILFSLTGPPWTGSSTYLDYLACLSAVLDCVVLYSALSQTALRAVQCCLRLSSAYFSAVPANCFQLDSARYPSVFNLTAFGLIPPCSRQRSSWTEWCAGQRSAWLSVVRDSYGKIQSAKAKSFVYTKSRQYWIELYTKLSRKAYTKYVTCFNAALFWAAEIASKNFD